MDNWPVACFELDWADRESPICTWINQRARELFGISAGELYPAPLSCLARVLTAQQYEDLKAQWAIARERLSILDWEGECLPHGSDQRIWLRAEPYLGRWRCVIEDVTDLQKKLVSSKDKLAETALNITEAIPVGTYTMVLEPGAELASFRFLSERFLQLTGLNREAALSDPLQAFACVHPDDYDAWLQLNAQAFANTAPFFGETRIIVNNEVRWITAESIPRALDDGSIVWEGVLIDVTERVLAQQKLQDNEQALRKILDNIPVPVCLFSLGEPKENMRLIPRISFINDTFVRTFGYTRTELSTLDDLGLRAFPDPEYHRMVFGQLDDVLACALSQRGSIGQMECRVHAKDGAMLEVLVTAAGLEAGTVVAFVDVTQIRRAERHLLEAMERERDREEQLRRVAEDKLRVSLAASAVAHEIRQPLSSILMTSRMAQQRLSQINGSTEALDQLITSLVVEAQHMADITDRISLLLRNVETDLHALDLRPLIQGALLPLRTLLRDASITVHCQQPETSCMVKGDAIQLQLAISNLFRNGIDALRQAKVPFPKLKVTLGRYGSRLELRIADNGPGFSNIERFMEPLNTLKDKGTGIGLYVVRLTMDNHGGSVRLQRSSELGGGEVVLTLPSLPETAVSTID